MIEFLKFKNKKEKESQNQKQENASENQWQVGVKKILDLKKLKERKDVFNFNLKNYALFNINFEEDKIVYCIQKTNGKETFAINEEISEQEFLKIKEISFSPDGKKIAAIIKNNNEKGETYETIIVDNKIWNRKFETCKFLKFINNNNDLITAAKFNNKFGLIINEQEVTAPNDDILELKTSYKKILVNILHNNEEKIVSYTIENNNLKRKEEDLYFPVYRCKELAVNPNGEKNGAIFLSNENKKIKYKVMINGQTLNEDFEFCRNLTFSPDGQRFGFIVKNNKGLFNLFVDNKILPSNYSNIFDLRFSQDSKNFGAIVEIF